MKIAFCNPGDIKNINQRMIMRGLRNSKALEAEAKTQDNMELKNDLNGYLNNQEELYFKDNVKEIMTNMRKTNMDKPWYVDGGAVNTSKIRAPENDVKAIQEAGNSTIKKQNLLSPSPAMAERQSTFLRLQKMAHEKERREASIRRSWISDRRY